MAASPPRERGASPPPAPAGAAANGATVYVGNLSGDTEREQLREAMNTFGRVATATVRCAAAALWRCGGAGAENLEAHDAAPWRAPAALTRLAARLARRCCGTARTIAAVAMDS